MLLSDMFWFAATDAVNTLTRNRFQSIGQSCIKTCISRNILHGKLDTEFATIAFSTMHLIDSSLRLLHRAVLHKAIIIPTWSKQLWAP